MSQDDKEPKPENEAPVAVEPRPEQTQTEPAGPPEPAQPVPEEMQGSNEPAKVPELTFYNVLCEKCGEETGRARSRAEALLKWEAHKCPKLAKKGWSGTQKALFTLGFVAALVAVGVALGNGDMVAEALKKAKGGDAK